MPKQQKRLKADERRDKLMNAATKLFTEKGYRATRMEEIAAAAGCSTGPLYYFFKTKPDIFEGALQRTIDVAVSRVRAMRNDSSCGSALNRLNALIDILLDTLTIPQAKMFVREGPSILGAKQFQAIVDNIMMQGIEADLREAMVDGEIDPEPPGPLAEIFSAAVLNVIIRADANNKEQVELSRNAIKRMAERLRR